MATGNMNSNGGASGYRPQPGSSTKGLGPAMKDYIIAGTAGVVDASHRAWGRRDMDGVLKDGVAKSPSTPDKNMNSGSGQRSSNQGGWVTKADTAAGGYGARENMQAFGKANKGQLMRGPTAGKNASSATLGQNLKVQDKDGFLHGTAKQGAANKKSLGGLKKTKKTD